jgi:DNA-binding CsgD family transcriptional regulator
MHLVAQGLTNKEIAVSLNLSEFTVKNHIRRVMRPMEAESRHEAVDLIRATVTYLHNSRRIFAIPKMEIVEDAAPR